MSILTFLKSPRVIGAILGVALTGGGVFFGINLLEEKGQMEEKLRATQTELANVRKLLQSERERFKQRIANYDEIMGEYLDDLNDASKEQNKLRNTISKLSKENEQLQQCFNTEAPKELLDQLFGVPLMLQERENQ